MWGGLTDLKALPQLSCHGHRDNSLILGLTLALEKGPNAWRNAKLQMPLPWYVSFSSCFFFFFSLSDLILGFCFTLITRFLSVNNRVSERSGKFVTYIVFSVDEEIRDHMLSKVQGFHIVRFLKLHLFGISRNMSTGLFLSFLSSKKWSRY